MQKTFQELEMLELELTEEIAVKSMLGEDTDELEQQLKEIQTQQKSA